VFGIQRGRIPETVRTNGNPGNLCQRSAAEAAVIGEKKRKESLRNCEELRRLQFLKGMFQSSA
jgi:hypothetical protein